MDLATLKPFSKKTFFLDLKNIPTRTKLAADLELLGGKEVPLSKSVSFVVSDRISENEDSSISPTTSNHISKTFDIFNNSCLNSPVFDGSPMANSRPRIMTRNMVILQKAMKKQSGTTNVMEICKKWNIKMFPAQKVLCWVKKYKALYSSYYAAEEKKCAKKGQNLNDGAQKLNGPFVKIEDEKKEFKTRYREFSAWKDIIDPSLSRAVTRLRGNITLFGNINDSVRPPLRETNRRFMHPNLHPLNTRSVSLTKISGNVSVSNVISTHPANTETKENISCYPTKRKLKDIKTVSKIKYCEVCSTRYSDLEAHLNSELHQNFINKEKYFDGVVNVISSLPQASDFLSSLSEAEKNSKMERKSLKGVTNKRKASEKSSET